MATTDEAKLYGQWLMMWNGRLELARELIAADCRVHQAPFGEEEPDQERGPERIIAMVTQGRAPFSELTFTLEVGPIVEGDKLAARWTGRGIYRGGIPGASAPAGKRVVFSGIDLWRIDDGKVAEYWVCSDALHLMHQLGAMSPPSV